MMTANVIQPSCAQSAIEDKCQTTNREAILYIRTGRTWSSRDLNSGRVPLNSAVGTTITSSEFIVQNEEEHILTSRVMSSVDLNGRDAKCKSVVRPSFHRFRYHVPVVTAICGLDTD